MDHIVNNKGRLSVTWHIVLGSGLFPSSHFVVEEIRVLGKSSDQLRHSLTHHVRIWPALELFRQYRQKVPLVFVYSAMWQNITSHVIIGHTLSSLRTPPTPAPRCLGGTHTECIGAPPICRRTTSVAHSHARCGRELIQRDSEGPKLLSVLADSCELQSIDTVIGST